VLPVRSMRHTRPYTVDGAIISNLADIVYSCVFNLRFTLYMRILDCMWGFGALSRTLSLIRVVLGLGETQPTPRDDSRDIRYIHCAGSARLFDNLAAFTHPL
jgi:hypothetical protein